MPLVDSGETTIPCLPCGSLDGTLPFYQALGFGITYQQKSPNPYAVVCRGGIALHLFGMKGLLPEHSYSICIVVVPDLESLHQTFAEVLRQTYGKLPIAGFPRISRMKPGQRRFTVVDPAGNSVVFSQRGSPSDTNEQTSDNESRSRLARAIDMAATLRDSKGDDVAAAKVLDVALGRDDPSTPVDRVRALAARAELAVALGDVPRARTLQAELSQIPLSEDDRERLRGELDAADRLERDLTPVESVP